MSHPNKILFEEGISHIFKLWPALTLAVQNEWGGPESKDKSLWMQEVIIDEFGKRGKKLEVFDIEDILAQIMSDEFETVLEDDSAYMVAKDVFKLYKDIIAGDQAFLLRLRDAVARRTSAPVINAAPGQESSDEEEGDEELSGDDEAME